MVMKSKRTMGKFVRADADTKKAYKPVKPQAVRKALRKLAKKGSSLASRRWKPSIVKSRPGCAGLVLGQAPPGPRESLPKNWKPLAGPAEQRLAKLSGLD